jgi:hypothetical protein
VRERERECVCRERESYWCLLVLHVVARKREREREKTTKEFEKLASFLFSSRTKETCKKKEIPEKGI